MSTEKKMKKTKSIKRIRSENESLKSLSVSRKRIKRSLSRPIQLLKPLSKKGQKLFSHGTSLIGCLGLGAAVSKTEAPQEIKLPFSEPIKNIYAGSISCALITESGKLWTWGDAQSGVLGRPLEKPAQPVQVKQYIPKEYLGEVEKINVLCKENKTKEAAKFFMELGPVLSVSLGESHMLVLLDDDLGTLLGCGVFLADSFEGLSVIPMKLGEVSSTNYKLVPGSDYLVYLGEGFERIVSGSQFGLLATNFSLFSVGLPPRLRSSTRSEPLRICPVPLYQKQNLGEVITMAAGENWACVLHKDGAVVWGNNNEGQLGFLSKNKIVDEDETVFFESKFCTLKSIGNAAPIKIEAGKEHCILLDESGEAWSWGANNGFCLGRNEKRGEFSNTYFYGDFSPTKVNFAKFTDEQFKGKTIDIACGEENSFFVSDKGTLFCCGNPNLGKKVENKGNTAKISLVYESEKHKVVRVAAGFRNVLFLVE